MQDIVAMEAESYSLGDLKRAPSLVTLAWAEVAAGRPKDGLHSLERAEKLMAEANLPPDDNVNLIAITRAEALMREHAYRSGENKRRNFPHIEMRTMILETPGVGLVRPA